METPVAGSVMAPANSGFRDLTEDDFVKPDASSDQQKDEQSTLSEVDLELKEELDPPPKLNKIQQFLPHEMERWGRLRDHKMADLEQYAAKVGAVDKFPWSSDETFASYLLDCLEEDLAHGDKVMPEDKDAMAESLEVQLVYPHQGARWERLRDRMLSIPYLDRYIIKYPGWSRDELLSCCLLDRMEEQLENEKQEAHEKQQREELEKLHQDGKNSSENDADDGDKDTVEGDNGSNEEGEEEDDSDDPDYVPPEHCSKQEVKTQGPVDKNAAKEQGDKKEASEKSKKETWEKPKVRVFICNLCKWQSDTKMKSIEHFEEKHLDRSISDTESGLQQGKKRPLPTRTKDYATMFWSCLECEAYVEDLAVHKRSCPGVACKVCGKICPKRCILRSHIKRRHTLKKEELKNQLCDLCGKLFYNRSDLNIHIKRHLGIIEKNHVCKVCGKAFYTGDKLNRHKAVHMEEKPFECCYCGQRFAQKYNMKLHTRIHTGIKPYQCDMCSESFSHNVSLKNHKKKAHGIDWWKKDKLPKDHPFLRRNMTQK